MAKKRIIGSILVKNNLAIQSYGYHKYRPLGDPVDVAENLARWQVDEIIVNFIDLTKKNYEPNYDLIKKISRAVIGTPLTYGGAIRSAGIAKEVIKSGADRVLIDNLFYENPDEINKISKVIGRQATILSLPFITEKIKDDTFIYHFNYMSGKKTEISNFIKKNIFDDFSEILLIDKLSDGGLSLFNKDILKYFINFYSHRLICMGGIDSVEKINHVISENNCDGISIGNSLSFSENRIHKIKSEIYNLVNVRY